MGAPRGPRVTPDIGAGTLGRPLLSRPMTTRKSRLNQVRVAVMVDSHDNSHESMVRTVAEQYSFDLQVEHFDSSTADLAALMDLLEVFPKDGFVAVDLRGPRAQDLTLLATWTISAHEAGVVDSMCYTGSDADQPDGYNVSFLAIKAILSQLPLDVRGRSVVLVADSIVERGVTAALVGSGVADLTTRARTDTPHTQETAKVGVPLTIDLLPTGRADENRENDSGDPAIENLRWLFWAERLRQLIQAAGGPDLPFSFSQELAAAEHRLLGGT